MQALLLSSVLSLLVVSTLPAQIRTIAERLGHPAGSKLLIIHADDLGAAHSINAASFDALDKGDISSASVMVPTPWITEVAAYAKSHPNADLGLHLTITSEWETYRWGSVESADKVPSLLDSAGTFPKQVAPVAARAKPAEVERELRAQIDRAVALGIRPTHLDSHMGALFSTPELIATYVKVARDYKLPFLALRGDRRTRPQPPLSENDVLLDTVVIAGTEVPRDRWKEFYLKAIADLKPGLTEMIVHLGRDDSELQAITVDHEPYGSAWRQRDYDVVRSAEFKKALKENNVIVVTWKDLQKLIPGAQSPVGIFDAQTGIGRGNGSASYDADRQTYLVEGSGQNMWNDRDDFHFVWKRMAGNFILSTRASFIGAGIDPHRKIGWSIRPTLETNTPHVSAALHGDGLMSLQFRRASGGTTEEAKSRVTLPDSDAVVQLERRDGVYVMSVARFGDTLVTQDLSGISLPDTVYVGLFVCAHHDTAVERALFSNVRITTPAKRELVPYRDYLGSKLEILDVATGNATIVHQYRGSFQAPEWTRDGKALIYAQEGRLYRFDLSSRAATPINTGFATRNNNDHVLSFDGRMLGISHHAAEDSGASIIYALPATGGTPRRITPKGPSYLHGWSPDGRWLVYTGVRGKELDVYKIPVSGIGREVRLTSAPGLDDGPEFTPDGTYIYFNSSRSGRMQIWRMRPDGSQQQQITNDSFNNWFPHISPDGKWIAYIAFPPEVDKDDHPFYRHVTLRLMPIGGGPARVIAYLYGGQGTINVPSWSPDGRRLAFVSNSAMP